LDVNLSPWLPPRKKSKQLELQMYTMVKMQLMICEI
jgi:Tfp pilus assembly protein PilN